MVRSGVTRAFDTVGRLRVAAFIVALGVLAAAQSEPARSADAAAPASTAHVADGKTALEKRAYDMAILQFERAITTDPRNARAFAWLGFAHRQAGRPEKARKYFRLALDIDPGEIKALLWNGQMDVEEQDIAAAREKLARMARVCVDGCDEYRTLEHSIRMLTAKLEAE